MLSAKDKVNFGIIGFGRYAENRLLPAFQRTNYCSLYAISKRDESKASEKAAKYKIPKYYSNLDLLASDSELNAVIICSPPKFHHEHTILCAESGKHVMVEKPIATRAEEVEDMIKVCAANKVIMMSAFVMRFIEAIRFVQKVIEEGELGKIDFVEGHLIMDAKKIPRDWLWDPEISGGGPVADLASHIIDLMFFILNLRVLEVISISIPRYSSTHIERKAVISMLFEKNIIGNIYVSFDAFRESGLTFYGSEGKLNVYNFNRTDATIQIKITKNLIETMTEVQNNNYHASMLDHFAETILFRKELLTPGQIGLDNQKIIDRIYFS